jgi:pimeloyl-ACP methyl ester carboxylesterase
MEKKHPVVVVPGFGHIPVYVSDHLHSLSAFEMLEKRGYNVISRRNNILSLATIREQAEALAKTVDETCLKFKTDKVDIIGISMGGIVTMYYLHNLFGAEKVNKFIAVASPFQGTMAAFWGNIFMWPLTTSLFEISPWSPVIANLWKKPRLPGVKFYTVTGLDDLASPPHTGQHKFAINVAPLPFGHWWLSLALDESILDTVESILKD